MLRNRIIFPQVTSPIDISIIGAACRLPGAPDEQAFRRILNGGEFTVSKWPHGRWHSELFYHPAKNAPGGAYIFAGGYLGAPYDFDAAMFGISPREALQMDPQQRLLAELVWEALENARIPPPSLAGKNVGVYIGVSALDHANRFGGDPTTIDSHFMTGNTLSIVANRISYLYDLKGPSLVIDTACSSSLVAVDTAVRDLASGRVDMAVVGGVNMLLSPASFIGFSRAQMLSPTGACRPFSDKADGYVRAEGGVVFILQPSKDASLGATRAVIAGGAVNSDGRTGGIALPGLSGQRDLLERAYDAAGVDPAKVAFVEAHGTGTLVGDPVEATAIGQVLGRRCDNPLPIGSVKSNIGHLEPASGVAGMMKALIALEQRELPASLHLDRLSPHIDFADLNLAPATAAIPLGSGNDLWCGVSSFGFGGTNAHVIMRSAAAENLPKAPVGGDCGLLVLSSQCSESLAELAAGYAQRLNDGADPAALAAAAANGRALLRQRAVLPLDTAGRMAAHLMAFARGEQPARGAVPVTQGTALPGPSKVCFIYNGNGAQWAGMGRDAYTRNPNFRAAFDAADAAFGALGFASLAQQLFAADLDERLGLAACAQPLIFAIQHGVTMALAALGMKPQMTLGHSVGEIAAAHACGAISLEDAAHILAARSHSQEAVHNVGGMAAAATGRANAARIIAEAGLVDIDIAADNAPSSVTLSGSIAALRAFARIAKVERIAVRELNIEYPYHSAMLDHIQGAFLEELGTIHPRESDIPFISTVTGGILDGASLDREYWWRNIREQVQFHQGVRTAVDRGANLLVEIGPRELLVSAISATATDAGATARVIHSLSHTQRDCEQGDPIRLIHARAIANGLAMPEETGGFHLVDRSVDLPSYPWQRRTFAHSPSSSAIDLHGNFPRHPLIGERLAQGTPEWRTILDRELVPYLADHVVGGEVLVPATAFAEMALAVARDLWPEGPISLEDFDILHALVLPETGQRKISVRYSDTSSTVEIWSRVRGGGDEWTLHARGRIARTHPHKGTPPRLTEADVIHAEPEEIYRKAVYSGIDYGPAFQQFRSLRRRGEELIEVKLGVPDPGTGAFTRPQILHPASLDAAFHGLFDFVEVGDPETRTWLPIRFERLRVWEDGGRITAATVKVDRDGDQLKTVSLWLFNEAGDIAARLDGALLRAVSRPRQDPDKGLYHLAKAPASRQGPPASLTARLSEHLERADLPAPPDGWLLLHAHYHAALREAFATLADQDGLVDLSAVLSRPGIDENIREFGRALIDDAASAGILESLENSSLARLAVSGDEVSSHLILQTCLADFPTASADIALSAQAAASLRTLLQSGEASLPREPLLERQYRASLRFAPARDTLLGCIEAIALPAQQAPHVVILEPKGEALRSTLAQLAINGTIRLSIAVPDKLAGDRLRKHLPRTAPAEIVDLSQNAIAPADICIIFQPEEIQTDGPAIEKLADILHPGGAMLLCVPAADSLLRFQHGPDAPEADHAVTASFQASEALENVVQFGGADQGFTLLLGQKSRAPRNRKVVVSGPAGERTELTALLIGRGFDAAVPEADDAADDEGNDRVVWMSLQRGTAADLVEEIEDLRTALFALRDTPSRPRIWLILFEGANGAPLRAFARVAMNEWPELDVAVLECAADVEIDALGVQLGELLDQSSDEREWYLAPEGLSVSRLQRGLPYGREPSAESLAFECPHSGMLEDFRWAETSRRQPGTGEVEIEVLATGLNFRDVMLAMGLLNDDVLEEGMAGAVYGLECSGRVVRVGEGVKRLSAGDLVTGFGQNSFTNFVTAPEQSFVRVPEGLPPDAAAALPVAFYTAWYALVSLARIKPGETVLVHGAAGGVGLAAVQIARDAGATVIATVSTPDKEAIARLYGASAVYNSRSLEFIDRIRDEFGGVDIVLNSLAGDAMRGSMKCLRPRGRFIELGKRDYVANSMVGLRPFRRNLSYFGVDVDQLLALDPQITVEGLEAIMDGFAEERFLPLPVYVYRSHEIAEAFRAMQAAAHIGKIVVEAPVPRSVPAAPKSGFTPADGVHLVVGGTRGFGFATAIWLAGKGADKIVVASRKGQLAPAEMARVDALRASGKVFEVVALDVTDAQAVVNVVASIARKHGPLGGVWHTAVELRDGLLETMTSDVLEKVLAPKVAGAENLHAATLDQPLGQFVMFSSASALIGNPGQGAYAAANGYLEGLARRRRAEGRQALAVAWGAIADVGLLANKGDTMESLARIAGVGGMKSGEALARLDHILVDADRLVDPVVTCAEFGKDGAMLALTVPSSPAFAAHFAVNASSIAIAGRSLAEIVADMSDADAHRTIVTILAEECAQIMRQAVEDVDLDASIDSLGMDSLMALELRMTIESKYRIELPMMAMSGVGNLRDLAGRVLRLIHQSGDPGETAPLRDAEVALIEMHGGSTPEPTGRPASG